MNLWSRGFVLPLGLALVGCATSAKKPPAIALAAPVSEVVPQVEPPLAAEPFAVPEAMRLPGQWKPLPATTPRPVAATDVKVEVTRALDEARVPPVREGFLNATQVWPFVAGALYQVYASPGRATLLTLQPGEQLVDIAGGDTARWIVDDSVGGAPDGRVNIVVKPTRADLENNLAVITDRRIYFLELISTEKTWMASVSWTYPRDRAAQRQVREVADSRVGLSLENLHFRYVITGGNPPWKPRQAFDDGRKVYIRFPEAIAQGELPPLFVVGPQGDGQLVNYRYVAPYYVVDRLFGVAELRLGVDKADMVRIERSDVAGRR